MTAGSRSAAPMGAIREVLRERRDRVGPYVKARHVAAALEVPVQVVTPRLSALVEAGDLEVWSDSPPRTYLVTLDEGDHLPVDGPGKLDSLSGVTVRGRPHDDGDRERRTRVDRRASEPR